MVDDIARLAASEIAGRVLAGELLAADVAEAFLLRAEKIGPALNTWITLDREGALNQARIIDEAMAEGKDPGPLAGVPVGLKDIIDVAGLRTTAGSLILKDQVAAGDAPLTRKIRKAGAVILGKLNMHEFAFGPSGHNPHYGDQKNPWDTKRVTGGSSGGSGNAAATGQASITIGSDTGGSIR
ncbi:MAG: amidase, partial [Nitrospinota bacterium]